MRLRHVGSAIVLVGLVAACGSDGGDAVDPKADQTAASASIKSFKSWLKDQGFAAQPDDDDDDDDFDFTSDECKDFAEAFPGDDDSLPGETASEKSGDYGLGDLDKGKTEVTVTGSVGFVDSEDALDDVLDLYQDDRLPGCFEEALKAGFATEAEVEVSGLQVEPTETRVGDDGAGLHITAVLSASGLDFPITFDFALAQVGRQAALAFIGTIGPDEAPITVDEALEQLLATDAAGGS